jgi:ABC-type transport system involved in multi-copper enzyme maturation permease subunit
VSAVFLFEWRRALTRPRIAWWAVLALFPAIIVSMIRISPIDEPPREFWEWSLFALIPLLMSMLGTFLWTAPALSAELERKSWVYLAVRPHGSTSVLIGKYLAAVTWVLPAALVGLTFAVLIAQVGDDWKDELRIWLTFAALACFGCLAYAAVYMLLGAIFPKRAMVIAVAYTLIIEVVISNIPAVINKISVHYRLRALFVDWADIPIPEARRHSGDFDMTEWLGNAPASDHILILFCYTCGLLLATLALIRWREFSTAEESDV